MALVHLEGFGDQDFTQDLDDSYVFSNAAAIVHTTMPDRRSGCQSVILDGESMKRVIDIGTDKRLLVGFAYEFTPGATHTVLAIMSGSTVQASVVIDADGLLHIYRGDHTGTLLASASGGTELDGSSAYIEADITIDDSAGAATVHVDDTSLITATSLDTQVDGNDLDGVRIATTTDGMVADWYIIDPNDATAPTTRIGSTARVDCCEPIAAGFPSEWTASDGTQVDAVSGDPDADDAYVYATGTGQTDLYRVTAMTHSPTTVHGVRITAVAKLASGTSANLQLRAKQVTGAGSTTGGGAALGASYARLSHIVHDGDLDCATQDEFNALAFGFETY